MREPGTIVDGKYEVVETLGRGGMGEVYLARHLHLEELRVIKILRQDLAADETVQKRFLREARLATQIKHPNVAILYDFSRLPEGSFYMVWEHIEGQHVGQWLAEKGHLPLQPALELGIQTLRGLEAIHASGVVHRDVSPDNLMITRDRKGRYLVKIIDLGLAKNLVADPNFEVTQVGMFMGKLKYCSPEQAEAHNGEMVDARSDLYSFALVLYEMIVGQPPFDAENPHAAVMKRLSEPPLPLSRRNPEVEVPAELDQVFDTALARERDDRFPDAVHFIEALEPVAFELRQQAGFETATGRQRSAHQPTEIPATGAVPRKGSGSVGRPRDESSQLSKAERVELLAQIDRAARKKTERLRRKGTDSEGSESGERPASGVSQPSADAATELPFTEPVTQPIDQDAMQQALAEDEAAPEAPDAAPAETADSGDAGEGSEPGPRRIREIEEMIEGYIRNRQLQLAELAFETLLELKPFHAKRSDYEQWIGMLRDELEQDRLAEETLTAGREALEEGDFKAARKRLAELGKLDRTGELVPAFQEELEATERQRDQSAGLEEHRGKFEELVEKGQLADAEKELKVLADLGATRVTLDLLRSRLQDAHRLAKAGQEVQALEKRFRRQLEREEWAAARATAQKVSQALPDSSRPAEMVAEISRVESESRRRESAQQGVQQVEQLIEAGDADQAEMALQVLLRMDPQNKRRKALEKKIRALRG